MRTLLPPPPHTSVDARTLGRAARPARIVHQVPGRIRIKVTGAKEDSAYFAMLQRMISDLAGVESVRVSASSASIVVAYNPSDPGFHYRIRENNALSEWLELSDDGALIEAIDDAVTTGVRYLERHSRLAESVVSSAEQLDSRLRRASDGYLDLKLGLPLGVAAAAALHKARGKGTPMWMSMSVFAFNTFLSLHRHRIDTPMQDAATRRERHA